MPDALQLILDPLSKAVLSLEEVLTQPKSTYIRDATIQRFEYTFELAVKFIQRALEAGPSGMTVDQLSYRDMIRAAAEAGIVADPASWFTYREARNITSHAYDERKAEQVYEIATQFVRDARRLVDGLTSRL